MSISAPATRFDAAFSARGADDLPGLVPYFTAGFPTLDALPGLLVAAERAGCIAAEVGIPFSDPLADGPAIQRSGTRALRNGMTVRHAFEQIAGARARGVRIPVAPMTYVNPVLAYGVDVFMRDAAKAGADGVILPDVPADETHDLRVAAHAAGLALIPLVAPTTARDRLARICATATGFLYCVSVTGVTGARDRIDPGALELLEAARACTTLPRALGFGLRTHAHLELLRGRAEAAVVGSALIDAIDAQPSDAPGAAERFLLGMRSG